MEGRIKSIAEFRLIPEYLTNISDEGKNFAGSGNCKYFNFGQAASTRGKKFFQRCDNDDRERNSSKRTDRVNQKP